LVENTLLRETPGEVSLPTEELKNEKEENERELSRSDWQTNRHSFLLSQSLAAIAFANLSLRYVQALEVFFPFGPGKNVLGVLVQVQLRMVQISESNGSIFSGDVWSENS
jgi:hypothetical protein